MRDVARRGLASRVLPYGAAAGAVAIAGLLRGLLDPAVAREVPFVNFYAAIMISAWLGGMGPGLLATALGALVGASIWGPRRFEPEILTPWHLGELSLFLVNGLVISGLTGRLSNARSRAERLNLELQTEIREHRRAEEEAMARAPAGRRRGPGAAGARGDGPRLVDG